MTSEESLIKLAQQGSSEAFCQLAHSYQYRIYSLALHYTQHRHDAEDLSQEVWLKAYRAIASFRAQSSFYTWLRQIMINTFLNYQRNKMVMVDGEQKGVRVMQLSTATENLGILFEDRWQGEKVLYHRALVEKVMTGLSQLSPQERLIFLLKHREGMTGEEIAQCCDISIGTVKKALFRAVNKLREYLGVKATTGEYFSIGDSH